MGTLSILINSSNVRHYIMSREIHHSHSPSLMRREPHTPTILLFYYGKPQWLVMMQRERELGSSDDSHCLPTPCSSDELSSILRQILSRAPTTQPSSPPKRNVSSAEMFDRNFSFVSGGAVSTVAAGYAVAENGEDKCAFEDKVKNLTTTLKRNYTRFV